MASDLSPESRIAQCFPFQLCDPKLIKEFLALGEVREFGPNEVIFSQNAERKQVGLILEGEVLCVRQGDEENNAGILFKDKDWIGLNDSDREVFFGYYPALFVSYNGCTVFLLKCSDFERYSFSYPELSDCMDLLTNGFLQQLNEKVLIPNISRFTPILCDARPHAVYWIAESIMIPALFLLGAYALGRGIPDALEKIVPALVLFLAAIRLIWRFIKQLPHRKILITRDHIVFYTDSEKPSVVLPLNTIRSVRLIPNLPFFYRLPCVLLLEREVLPSLWSFPLSKARIISALLYCLITDSEPKEDDQSPSPVDDLHEAVTNTPEKLLTETDDLDEETDVVVPDADIFILKSPQELNSEKLVNSVTLPVVYHSHWVRLVKMIGLPVSLVVMSVVIGSISNFDMTFPPSMTSFATIYYIFLIILLLFITYFIADWKNDTLRIEKDCVRKTAKRPFTKEMVSVIFADKIQNVRFSRNGLLQILLNYGTVYVMAGVNEIEFRLIPNPKFVSELILEMQKRHTAEEKRKDDERLNQFVTGIANALYQKKGSRGRSPQTKEEMKMKRMFEEHRKNES